MKIMGRVKGFVLDIANWSKKHLEKLIILIGVFIMTFILFVLLSWGIGYYGMKFDLGSIWQGLGACVAAITGLLTLAATSLAKLYVNSRYNSPSGEKPQRRDGEHETGNA